MRFLLTGLLLAGLSSGCASTKSPADAGEVLAGASIKDLNEAEARWNEVGSESYTVTLTRSCFCPPAMRGPFEVTVTEGEVTEALYEGAPVPDASSIPTITVMFNQLREAYVQHAARVDVTYDAEWGYPVEIYIDQRERIADEEVGYSLDGLHLR